MSKIQNIIKRFTPVLKTIVSRRCIINPTALPSGHKSDYTTFSIAKIKSLSFNLTLNMLQTTSNLYHKTVPGTKHF